MGLQLQWAPQGTSAVVSGTAFISRGHAGTLPQGSAAGGGTPTWFQVCTSSKASTSKETKAAISSHSPQASWNGVTTLWNHMSPCPDSQGL